MPPLSRNVEIFVEKFRPLLCSRSFQNGNLRVLCRGLVLSGITLLTGCGGQQSALNPAGRGAEQVITLFFWLAGGGIVVWLFVLGLAIYSLLHPETHSTRKARFLIIGGGFVIPTIILTAYLTYGLSMLPDLLRPAPEGSLRINVTGEQWWWRVRYLPPGGESVELANELHLPVGERVELLLDSPDVIHSFWIPSISGKIDMIPGRVTRMTIEPTRTGIYRGACAEYCGASHALMNFYVVVEEKEEFERWLAHQASPARPPATPRARRGMETFIANGCGACHAVRGTPADGVVGPDLTHVGGRVSIGAGILPNQPEAFLQWISRTEHVKPEVMMPAFGMLPGEDLRALAAYLDELE